MELKKLNCKFSVCKVKNIHAIDYTGEFVFIGRTDREVSLVCETQFAPKNVIEREDGWLGFRIEGQLEFSLIGIIAKISKILAENQIGIFVISTYDTDYVLVKENNYDKALTILRSSGYHIVE